MRRRRAPMATCGCIPDVATRLAPSGNRSAIDRHAAHQGYGWGWGATRSIPQGSPLPAGAQPWPDAIDTPGLIAQVNAPMADPPDPGGTGVDASFQFVPRN